VSEKCTGEREVPVNLDNTSSITLTGTVPDTTNGTTNCTKICTKILIRCPKKSDRASWVFFRKVGQQVSWDIPVYLMRIPREIQNFVKSTDFTLY
jgi:hypothetical protein